MTMPSYAHIHSASGLQNQVLLQKKWWRSTLSFEKYDRSDTVNNYAITGGFDTANKFSNSVVTEMYSCIV